MKEYKDYQGIWSLSNPTKIATTETSELYEVDSPYGPAVLKVLNEAGKKHEAVGATFLKACEGQGAAKLYQYDDGAHLIERLYGENLYQFSKVDNEELASKYFVEIIKKIHAVDYKALDLKPVSFLFDAFTRVKIPPGLKDLIEQGSELAKDLQKTQVQEVLLHGDLHHENIMQRKTGEFVCFDAQACVGDPAYELGTTLKNPWDYQKISHDRERLKSRARYFSRELNLPYERILSFSFVHVCLSICWALEDGGNYEHSLGVAKILRPLL
jgi:streptomycin 6-kinase